MWTSSHYCTLRLHKIDSSCFGLCNTTQDAPIRHGDWTTKKDGKKKRKKRSNITRLEVVGKQVSEVSIYNNGSNQNKNDDTDNVFAFAYEAHGRQQAS